MTHETDVVARIMTIRNGMIVDADAEALIRDALDVRGGIPSEEEIDASGAPHSGIRRFSPETASAADLEKADTCERLSFPPEDSRHITIDKLLREYAAILRSGHAPTPEEPHETTYLRGWNEAVESCAVIAEGFDAACDSPRMKLFVDAGLVLAVYKRDGEIGAAIRALADTSTDRTGK